MSTLTHSIALGQMVALVDRRKGKSMRRRRFVLLGARPEGVKLRPTIAAGDVTPDLTCVLDWGVASADVLAALQESLRVLDAEPR